MKKTFLLISLITFFCKIHAQPVVNYCYDTPSVGDSLTVTDIRYDTAGVTYGSPGTNITWDYSALNVDSTYSYSVHYYTPGGTPGGIFFPFAQIAGYYDPSNIYEYYSYSLDSISSWGNYVSSGSCIKYNDPYVFMDCPLSYGASFTDKYSGADCTGSNVMGSATITYDGYGTLILPSVTFSNTIRIHSNVSQIIGSFSFTSNEYYWTDVTTSNIVFSIIFISSSWGTDYFFIDQYNKQNMNVIKRTVKRQNVSVHFNTGKRELIIRSDNINSSSQSTLIIENYMGQIIGKILINSNLKFIKLKDVSNGLYIYQLQNDNGIIKSGKFIIE